MIHSKWAEGNPVFGDKCSLIRVNSSGGFWFSTNCSDEHTLICASRRHNKVKYMIPHYTSRAGLQELTQTERVTGKQYVTLTGGTSEETSNAEITTGMSHGFWSHFKEKRIKG